MAEFLVSPYFCSLELDKPQAMKLKRMANRKGLESFILNPLILCVPLPESGHFLKILKHVISPAKNWIRLQLEGFCIGHSLTPTWRTLAYPQPPDSTRLEPEFKQSITA